MITVMFIGLSILPLSALIFGALFLSRKFKSIHLPSFFVFGLLTMFVDLYYFHKAYEVSLSNGQFGPIAGTISMFSVIVTINAFCFGLLGAVIYALFSRLTKKQDTYSKLSFLHMAIITVLAISSASYQIMNHHSQADSQKIIARASGDLTPEIVTELLQIDQNSKDKTMITTLLMNPSCPESVLKDYSQKDLVVYRSAVLKNPNVPQEVVNQLASDPNEVVRYHVVINKKVTAELLELLAKDRAKDVRNKAKSELENLKAITK